MKRILVYGMKEPIGGVETVVMSYLRHFDHSVIRVDCIVFNENFSLKNEIEQYGGKVFLLPRRKDYPRLYKNAVRKLFCENNYDAVWCNYSGLTNIDFLKEAKKHGIKIRIAHSHTTALAWGSPLMKYAVIALHYKNRFVIDRYATHFFGCSVRATEFMFGKRNLKNSTVIPNAIDTSIFTYSEKNRCDTRKEYGIPEDAFVLGHVGRMCVAKNQFFLIDVFDEISKKDKNARLLFVGDGELCKGIISYANEKQCYDRIIFTGSKTDTYRYYSAMDVFCLPSLNEGFGVTLVEAQSCNLPCVASSGHVDSSVNVAGLVKYISLEKTPSQWADAIMNTEKVEEKGESPVSGSIFDIDVSVGEMQSIFCKN